MTEKKERRVVLALGYIELGHRLIKDGKVVEETKGGFVFDRKHGRLWAVIDLDKDIMVDASFDLKKAVDSYLKYEPQEKETTSKLKIKHLPKETTKK